MTITRYRKKPVEVDTIQWTGDNEAEVQAFTGGPSRFYALDAEDRENSDDPEATAAVFDKLHSTWVLVYTGQHIIRGVKGEYYPIAEDVLAETYEPVTPGPAATQATESQNLREQIAAAVRKFPFDDYGLDNVSYLLEDTPDTQEWVPKLADAVLAVILPATRITATLARMSEADVQRVIALYERWVKAGPPPLGVSLARWWDARLVELHNAILPPAEQSARTTPNNPTTSKEPSCTNESTPQKSPAPSPPDTTPTP